MQLAHALVTLVVVIGSLLVIKLLAPTGKADQLGQTEQDEEYDGD